MGDEVDGSAATVHSTTRGTFLWGERGAEQRVSAGLSGSQLRSPFLSSEYLRVPTCMQSCNKTL